MLLIALAMAQTGAPDIELGATVRARRVEIEKRGRAALTVRGDPDGGLVEVEAPDGDGRATLRDVEVRVRAQARVADPAGETTGPR